MLFVLSMAAAEAVEAAVEADVEAEAVVALEELQSSHPQHLVEEVALQVQVCPAANTLPRLTTGVVI